MTIDDYLELPYPITLVEEPSVEHQRRIWFAKVDDLPGCMSQGDTPDDAIAGVRDAMGAWIADALAEGEPVPTPRDETRYSGRFLVRVPRTLHRDLVREAEREGTSLNQFVTNALSAAVGWRTATSFGASHEHVASAAYHIVSAKQPLMKGEAFRVVDVEPIE